MFSLNPRDIEARILHFARCEPERLPSCMTSRQLNCEGCRLGDQSSCVLLQDTDFLSLLRWKILNLTRLIEPDITDDLVISLVEVFESQGSALHIDKILSLLIRQKQQQRIDLAQLKSTLKHNPEFFKETNTNVFILNSEEREEYERQTEQNNEPTT